LLSQQLCIIHYRGRNLEGQAGIENATVVPRPTPLLELYDQPVIKLAASKLTSSALVEREELGGELFTFGDGSCGKLGQGHTDTVHSPSRVSVSLRCYDFRHDPAAPIQIDGEVKSSLGGTIYNV
jgi:hypothetical protein